MNNELIILVKIILIDLVLSADNAIIIGMAASQFDNQIRKKVLIYGTIAAVVFRIILAGLTAFLLKFHGIKTAGALMLFWVVYKLYVDILQEKNDNENLHKFNIQESEKSKLGKAIFTILLADFSLSLDNVIAVAGAAGDHYTLLVFGLMLSIILMVTLANFISLYIKKYKWIGWLGLLSILWVAFDLLYQDYKYFFL
ncbi:MAG: YjbE family putative metal transport protein [Candidatus Fonsibacter sp.]